jgi:Fe-S cluster assembly iron-binding protein IscA
MYLSRHSEGCEGYTYKFKFDNQLLENDYVTLNENKKVVFALGEEELALVNGSTLDYVREMMR